MSDTAAGAGHLSLQEPSERINRTAGADPRDRAEPGPFRVQESSGAVEARRLASGQALGVSALQGRRPGIEEEATATEKGGPPS